MGEQTSSVHFVEEKEENDDDDDQEEAETKEESPLVEINDVKKEEPIGSVKIYAEKTSSIHSVKEAEDDDKEYGQELAPVERIEVWRKVEAFDDAPKASEDMTSIMHPVEKEEEEEEEHGDEEYAIEKGKENSEATESSSTGSNEEEIWPVELVEALCNGLAIPHSYSWQLASSSQANSCPMELIIVNQYRYVRQT
ncbi:uncharacterized protein LOC110637549 isoform X1 [Hevea brasiliensis]|uniref:uncharacterized protein LOC110637549 isoform X1 n=1 Tax=Hevea brasiliensis TaxID=3981 RepID=UPI0025D46178|nr:uncharacterized protein LOC110637549 isoform X1 [Hevea brasiliensis]